MKRFRLHSIFQLVILLLLAFSDVGASFLNQNRAFASRQPILNNYYITTMLKITKSSSQQPLYVHREENEKFKEPHSSITRTDVAVKKNRRSLVKSVAATTLAVISNSVIWDSTRCTSHAAINTTDNDYKMVPRSTNNKNDRMSLKQVTDPNTYSALVYEPPVIKSSSASSKFPLLVVLHGAGTNERDVWNLADIEGEHAGLVPSLIQAGKAPSALTDNFVVVAPYCGQGKRSFYEEPRNKILQFISWFCSDDVRGEKKQLEIDIDRNRIYLFGFSDGATEAVELLTTGRFKASVVAAYGFTGTLPPKAVERLKNIPMWVFHSQDDVIFPVKCSDKLVETLNNVNSNQSIVRYSRFQQDQEGFTGSVRGHSTGITASKSPEVYEWLLSL